ncbi:hypothetical protein Tco_0887309, partial [Tanacetum coccineum]
HQYFFLISENSAISLLPHSLVNSNSISNSGPELIGVLMCYRRVGSLNILQSSLNTAYEAFWIGRIRSSRHVGGTDTLYLLLWIWRNDSQSYLLNVDQGFIYSISVDVDTAYSSKSGNDLEFV